jgi:hypothetical protein
MTQVPEWPPVVGQAVKVIYGHSRNRMLGEVVSIERYGGHPLYLVMMKMPTGEPRAHLPEPIRCRLSDLEPVQGVPEEETPPGP